MVQAKEKTLPVIGGSAANRRLTRRQMVQRLLAGMSAGAVWPLAVASHPIYGHFRNGEILGEAEKLAAADWKPIFLSGQQNETLMALAEAIVPGSTKAEVSRFIDLLLSVDKQEHQHQFVESLAAFEAEAQKRFAKNFPSLDDNQKNMLLTNASLNAATDSPESHGAENNSALHEHFESLKGWVSGAYYSSEAGMRELGWTGDYAFDKFPGCEHPEGHH